ncbi:MBL fold metallo-hydrolase [Piscinibacter koreensis]|uniref:MBL fold metallo-hydrolase n=1 Tax=Piscinibacter koreensis TaxID=2742824 RepID=A0A7Y6TVR2_9BURK|nr:MBL fold metallo-hydrolase [Schlegelella koreensis]NUZ05268.1 MBL fold metallo-hydrolase [Schlegelella koreensis]
MTHRKRLIQPLVAAGALLAVAGTHAATPLAEARAKIFGFENVDAATGAVKKDKVVFSWLGHNAAAVSLLGRVIMLDAYIPRLEVTPGRTPLVIKDLVDLKPEAIFIGHGHSDHADNAAFIAARTGATLYMTPEACGTAQTALARMKNDPFMQADPNFAIPPATTISCVGITSSGSVPATELVRIRQFEPLVCINGFRALHSVALPPDPDWGPVQVVDTPDPRDPTLFPPGVPLTPTNPRQAGQQDLRQGPGPGGADQLDFQFVLRTGYNFSLFYNNSIGAFKEGKGSNWPNGVPADGQRVLNLMRSLPNTDLNFSSFSSGNTDENGWRDLVYHLEALRPRIVTSGHAPIGAALQYYSGVLNHLKLMEQPRNAWPGFPRGNWPVIRNHTDPTDLLEPEVYQPGDPAWFNPEKAARVAQHCS